MTKYNIGSIGSLEWEKINRKHKIYWTLNVRQVPVMDRYKSDVIWILEYCVCVCQT